MWSRVFKDYGGREWWIRWVNLCTVSPSKGAADTATLARLQKTQAAITPILPHLSLYPSKAVPPPLSPDKTPAWGGISTELKIRNVRILLSNPAMIFNLHYTYYFTWRNNSYYLTRQRETKKKYSTSTSYIFSFFLLSQPCLSVHVAGFWLNLLFFLFLI